MLTDTNLAAPATRWTLDFLTENIGDDQFTVYESNSHKFKYYDEKRANLNGFVPQMRRKEMTFKDFASKLKNWKPGEKRYEADAIQKLLCCYEKINCRHTGGIPFLLQDLPATGLEQQGGAGNCSRFLAFQLVVRKVTTRSQPMGRAHVEPAPRWPGRYDWKTSPSVCDALISYFFWVSFSF